MFLNSSKSKKKLFDNIAGIVWMRYWRYMLLYEWIHERLTGLEIKGCIFSFF